MSLCFSTNDSYLCIDIVVFYELPNCPFVQRIKSLKNENYIAVYKEKQNKQTETNEDRIYIL